MAEIGAKEMGDALGRWRNFERLQRVNPEAIEAGSEVLRAGGNEEAAIEAMKDALSSGARDEALARIGLLKEAAGLTIDAQIAFAHGTDAILNNGAWGTIEEATDHAALFGLLVGLFARQFADEA